jgi:protein-S-isoprenylcysteine O-methyltransferase Ste14
MVWEEENVNLEEKEVAGAILVLGFAVAILFSIAYLQSLLSSGAPWCSVMAGVVLVCLILGLLGAVIILDRFRRWWVES